MPLADLLPIAGALSAPAFLLIFALAALGAPFFAFLYLLTAALRSSPHLEAYASRLLRMALTCAVPSLLIAFASAGLAGYRTPWLMDWVRAAPLPPALLGLASLAFCASLLTLRRRTPRHGRLGSPLGQAFILAILAGGLLWLGLALSTALQEQARAVLHAPSESGLGVAPLILPDVTTMPGLGFALAAALVLGGLAAGAISLEYLLLRRDREPFGRDALSYMLRMAARGTLRCALLAAAFIVALWLRLPDMPTAPGGDIAPKLLLGVCTVACALVFLFSQLVAHSRRPWDRALTIHANMLALWLGLTALLSLGLINFYAG
ncbi:MAG: hypothetical protein AUJ49_06565 [Desulfovibrionaceae bacterium CG1_02_65_16]|nr:MAG: hypothetical protein AUJ49_06565 [Desulfovibrionaceae bacterium CG1_02_65_16]